MRKDGYDVKGWGHEFIFATNDFYCGKLLRFASGKKCSMHFHADKHETWYVLTGKFRVHFIETKDASLHYKDLEEGDTWVNETLKPHQLECLSAGTIIEVSTPDSVEDNYRVYPGDSQR